MKSFGLIFCNRNDSYADSQDLRINYFIDYYAKLQKKYPKLYFQVIDWNPPPDRPLLKDYFPWDKLRNVEHTIVSKEEHEKLFPKGNRKINDYTGRNIGIRNSKADFNVILNQDILIPLELFEEINTFPNYGKYFFRADRVDVKDSVLHNDQFFFVREHKRLLNFPLNKLEKNGRIRFFEKLINSNIVQKYSFNSFFYKIFVFSIMKLMNLFLSDSNKLNMVHFLFLHMNACGDFLVVPRLDSDAVLYPETEDFYMHTDGYLLVRLEKMGIKQVILSKVHKLYHIDHIRPDRSSDIPYSYHESEYVKILMDARS